MIDLYRWLRPRFWLLGYPICDEWDATLNSYMDRGLKYKRGITEHTIEFSDKGKTVKVWVSNYPYGFGNKWIVLGGLCLLPRPRTMDRLVKYINNQGNEV